MYIIAEFMDKIEEVFNILNELTVQELDLVRIKIRELKALKKTTKKPQTTVCGIRMSQKERMIDFNPFLKDKL